MTKRNNSNTTPSLAAAVEYINRKNRNSHPEGSFDKAGRFYPDGNDALALNQNVRAPSREWPYSYMASCRSMAHVCRMLDVDLNVVRRLVKRIEKVMKSKGISTEEVACQICQEGLSEAVKSLRNTLSGKSSLIAPSRAGEQLDDEFLRIWGRMTGIQRAELLAHNDSVKESAELLEVGYDDLASEIEMRMTAAILEAQDRLDRVSAALNQKMFPSKEDIRIVGAMFNCLSNGMLTAEKLGLPMK